MKVRCSKIAIAVVMTVLFVGVQTMCYASGITDTITGAANTANSATNSAVNTVTDASSTASTAASNATNTASNTVASAQSAVTAASDAANSVVGLNTSALKNLTSQAALAKLGASTLSVGNAVSNLGSGLLGGNAVADLATALTALNSQTKANTVSVSAIEAVDTAMQALQPALQTQLNQLQITTNVTTLLQQSVLKIGAANRTNAALKSATSDASVAGVCSSQEEITQSYGTMVYNCCVSNNIAMPTASEKTELANQSLATVVNSANTAVGNVKNTANTVVSSVTN